MSNLRLQNCPPAAFTMKIGTAAADNPESESSDVVSRPTVPFEPVYWAEAPPFSPAGPRDASRTARRSANHCAYRIHGNSGVWANYTLYGYYSYDDCHQFATVWKESGYKSDRIERNRIIWDEFHYRRMHDIYVGEVLNNRVNLKVLPHMKKHDADYLLATNLEFAERDPQCQSENQDMEWQEVSARNGHRKKKHTTPPTSPTLTATKNSYSALLVPDDETPNKDSDISEDRTYPLSVLGPYKTTRAQFAKKHTKTTTKAKIPPKLPTTTPIPIPATATHEDDNEVFIATQPDTTPLTTNNTTMQPPASIIRNPYKFPTSNRINKQLFPSTASRQPNSETEETQHSQHDGARKFRHGDNGTTASSTMNTKAAPYVNLNDGTIRLTVRWKPEQYNHLSTNFEDQTKEIEFLLQQLFENGDTNANLIQWTAKDTQSTKSIGAIIKENSINQYLSPKITHLNTSHQIIFGIRACFGNQTPSAWITQPAIKAIMASNQLHLSISNSRCDSGEVVTAGHLLFKHPQHTHRHFYLLSLRRILPENTPFFDLGTLHRTPHGEEITHLIIRCGANHVDALTDIMSDYLDGADNNTVLFLANKLVVSMTHEESHSMFACHADFVRQIQRIPLHPFVVNIDRYRAESDSGKYTERSTREWVTTLRAEDGRPLQCDVENGGTDRRAYLLVPTQHLSQAKIALEQYRSHLRQAGNQGNNHRYTRPGEDAATLPESQPRPTEIYVPTASVLKNLQRMQNLTSAEIWQAAPDGVRNTPPSLPTRTGKQLYPNQSSTGVQKTHSTDGYLAHATRKHSHNSSMTDKTQQNFTQQEEFPAISRRPSLDTTVATTQTPLSRTNTQQSTSFQELEAAFLRHQSEFNTITTTVTNMDARITRTMAACTTTAQQIVHIESRLDQMVIQLQQIVANTATAVTTPPRNQAHSGNQQNEQSPSPSDSSESSRSTLHCSSNNSMGTTTSKSSTKSDTNKSPKKKRVKKSDTGELALTSTHQSTYPSDQQGSQYNSNHPSDGGSHE